MEGNEPTAECGELMWEPLDLRAGDYSARLSTTGGGVAGLWWRGQRLVVDYPLTRVRPAFRGVVLAPWPNRLVDGRWRWRGQDFQLALTEPDRSHALHGLVVWDRFQVRHHSAAAATLTTTITAQDGYPFTVEVTTEYVLDAETGLRWRVRATAVTGPAPVGLGLHPYLVAGEGGVDDWELHAPLPYVQDHHGPRLLPGRLHPVSDDRDFTAGFTPLHGVSVDHAFYQPDTPTVIRLRRAGAEASGMVGVELATSAPWVQIYTGDLADPALPEHRIGVAVEPQTCAPNAFNYLPDDGAASAEQQPGAAHILAAGDSLECECTIRVITRNQ